MDWKSFVVLAKKEKLKTLLLTILGGFLLILNWFLFMYAVNHVSLKSASFAYLICPIITTILAYFILGGKEKMSFEFYIGALIIVLTVILNGVIKQYQKKKLK